MKQLLATLGNNIKPRGKDWIARCPIHNDKDFAMSVRQNPDGSVMAHCFACGANGLDLYKTLNLDLDELFGCKQQDQVAPQFIKDQYQEDKFFIAIFDADTSKGMHPTLKDKRRYRLAQARIDGIRQKYTIA